MIDFPVKEVSKKKRKLLGFIYIFDFIVTCGLIQLDFWHFRY